MGEVHDRLSLDIQSRILTEARAGSQPWSRIFTPNLVLVNNTEWPLTDGIIKDDQTKIQCGVEFKPPGQNKREYLTGLGQTIAYLDKNEYALFLLPRKSDDGFLIGEYIARISNSEILKNLPFGVVIYDDDMNLDVAKEIPQVSREVLAKSETSQTFWAFWRELSSQEIFLVLSEADKLYSIEGSIKRKVTDVLNEKRIEGQTLDPQGNMRKLGKKKGTETKDQTYRNTVPFLNALDLWDYEGNLSTKGNMLLRIGKVYGHKSKVFRDYLAYLVMTDGKHLQLITLIDEFQFSLYKDGELNVKNNEEFNKVIELYLEEKGLLRRAEGRRTTSKRKRLQSELTLWSWLGLIVKHKGTYFIENVGYKFDWERITELLNKNF